MSGVPPGLELLTAEGNTRSGVRTQGYHTTNVALALASVRPGVSRNPYHKPRTIVLIRFARMEAVSVAGANAERGRSAKHGDEFCASRGLIDFALVSGAGH